MAVFFRLSPPPFLLLLVLLPLSTGFLLPTSVAAGGSYDGVGGVGGEEEFTEELLLRPLPDRKVLAHFHFESRVPPSSTNGRHHHLFPKAIAQLVNKFQIQELELSFTQGRWNYERWGGLDYIPRVNAKPPGLELWAMFDLPIDQIDATWKNLTHALSGLFCSSINFLESTTAFAAPRWSFKSHSSNLRYGALPREAVCTENLTPWLKLLPCRDKAGLAFLLDRPSIYKGYYHSQRLHLFSSETTGIVLEQTLTIVLKPNQQRTLTTYPTDQLFQPNWSVNSVFRKKLMGQCVLAKSSKVFLELDRGLVREMGSLILGDSYSNKGFEMSVAPNRVIREALGSHGDSVLFEYNLNDYGENNPLDVGITWKLPFAWSCPQAPFHANRFLMGSGNERGSIAIYLQSTQTSESFSDTADVCMMKIAVFQIVPWYVRVYYHTLKVFVDGKPQVISDIVEKIQVSPSEDKLSPGIMEVMLRLPCSTMSVVLTMDFDKGFLHIDEYPPDANQGFDIPSAIVSFPSLHAKSSILAEDPKDGSPLLSKFQESNLVRSYTEVLLVPLTTPDFSMPYNVITFTCTVLALYFGSLLNVLRRRVAEEERLLNKVSSTISSDFPFDDGGDALGLFVGTLNSGSLGSSPSNIPSAHVVSCLQFSGLFIQYFNGVFCMSSFLFLVVGERRLGSCYEAQITSHACIKVIFQIEG
ncbi:hypothetical protein Taro_037840 [Colocasia esculenta]|uniref:GPI transamidase component PIG-T n=1 Tax=Colocasia esculenta TaxID=4460 RepID=A0A843WE23_COLES|nr:hypothetical protein [Colocasia esculenta]